MSSHSWMPFYPADYLKDTRRLTTVEHGAYLLLIMEYWEHRSLPDDDSQLAQIALMTEREWKRIRPKIEQFFHSGWRHARIDAELARADEKSVARAQAGARGGISKALRHATNGIAIAIHKPEPEPSNSHADATNLLEQNGKQNGAIALASSSHSPREDRNLSVSCPKQVRTKHRYSSEFEAFWKAYPTDANMGKREAADEWEKLSSDERTKALQSCQPFRLYCETHKDYRPIHANRYLSKGRFEGHTAVAERASESVFVPIGTPAWKAWDIHYRHEKGCAPPVDKQGNGWYFPSEFPPQETAA